MAPFTLTDAHNQVDHGDGVQGDIPQRHQTDNAEFDGDDGEGDPERADLKQSKIIKASFN